ncbi:DUF2971 domain-containing protein [Aeromonas salmonicida]|uniref:DUF2971 domain-containing protein n=1 Tax=Aeromonas salmonicida TaxID=645 RepID=UPI0030D0D31D
MDKSELPEEITALIEKAEAGDKIAQYNLGLKYRLGKGVKQSNSEAADWFLKAAINGNTNAQCNLGWMYRNGRGLDKNDSEALAWYHKAAEKGNALAQSNLGLMYMNGYKNGDIIEKDYIQAQKLFRQAATSTDPEIRFKAIEYQDQAERYNLSPIITDIRQKILSKLKVNIETTPTMTHYTSLIVGSALLLEESPLRLGHINALNDPNEGKLLWRYLGHPPVEGKPVFVGCFLPDEDSLNMWRFYSKNHQKDDACGCAITFNSDKFFDFNLLQESPTNSQQNDEEIAFINTGKSPQESATFYRIIYISDDMNIHDSAKPTLDKLFTELKKAVKSFLGNTPSNEELKQLSRLLGPLPYLLKDADYESEKEHRIIVTHLEYGAKEIKVQEPNLIEGTPPRLYLEMHRANHLAPIKHVTLGPKSPHQEMMAPYWYHQLASKYPDQLKAKPDFDIKASKCAYQ